MFSFAHYLHISFVCLLLGLIVGSLHFITWPSENGYGLRLRRGQEVRDDAPSKSLPIVRRSRGDDWVPPGDITASQWSDLVRRGSELISLMAASIDGADALSARASNPFQSQSSFDDPNQIDEYGWTTNDEVEIGSGWEHIPIEDAVRGVGLSTDDDVAESNEDRSAMWHGIETIHDEDTTISGTFYPFTRGFYDVLYNVQEGAMINYNIRSPKYMATMGRIDGPLPLLAHWSDLSFLTYEDIAAAQGEPVSRLKYVFNYEITTRITQLVIKKICEQRIQQQGSGMDVAHLDFPWSSNIRVDLLNTEEGLALLGTPHGSGVAWLLAQHKEQFAASKITTTANIFQAQKYPFDEDDEVWPIAPSMVISIQDSAQIQHTPWAPIPPDNGWVAWACDFYNHVKRDYPNGLGAHMPLQDAGG
ncbi:MAG: hypothetical protein M1820_006756 [Bogoriella megaspora]|nr:MAG: hypothetical protein M1820_006756 [Bogoriella megaspora]